MGPQALGRVDGGWSPHLHPAPGRAWCKRLFSKTQAQTPGNTPQLKPLGLVGDGDGITGKINNGNNKRLKLLNLKVRVAGNRRLSQAARKASTLSQSCRSLLYPNKQWVLAPEPPARRLEGLIPASKLADRGQASTEQGNGGKKNQQLLHLLSDLAALLCAAAVQCCRVWQPPPGRSTAREDHCELSVVSSRDK